MNAQRRPVFNPENPTIPSEAVRRSPQVGAGAVIRNSAIAVRSVPVVYDADDDGDNLRATELFNVAGASPMGPATPSRSFGGTALMPAAFSAEMREAIAASKRPASAAPPVTTSAPADRHAAPTGVAMPDVTRFEIGFAIGAAVVVGLSAAVLFVYYL